MRAIHASDSDEKLNELTSFFEDLKITLDELQIDPPADIDPLRSTASITPWKTQPPPRTQWKSGRTKPMPALKD